MKILIVTLISSLFFLFPTYAQKTSDKPFKGATKVVVTNTLSASENFKRLGQSLIDLNYFIASKDSEYLTLKSDPILVSVPGSSISQIIYIKVKESSIEFVAKVKFKGALSTTNDADAYELLSWRNDYPQEYAFKNILNLLATIPYSAMKYSE